MRTQALRILERIGGATLVLLGFAWLILGLRSLAGENFALRGTLIVVVIAGALVLSGAMLAKPRESNVGRILAIVVCVLGAFRELMLLDHQTTQTLAAGGWIGIALLALYVLVILIATVSLIANRRAAVQ